MTRVKMKARCLLDLLSKYLLGHKHIWKQAALSTWFDEEFRSRGVGGTTQGKKGEGNPVELGSHMHDK